MSNIDASQLPRMAQCSVTGKMVPEDELVDFQGQRVCAEGKAILLDRLKAGDALSGGFEHPGFWRRTGCLFLDGLIVGIPIQMGRFVLFGFANTPVLPPAQMLYGICTQIIIMFYFGQLHAMSGRTLGKRAGKIIVVNLDGSPISSRTAYIRALAYGGIGLLSPVVGLIAGREAFLIMSGVGSLWLLAEIVAMLIDRDRQRTLHDRIAGTRVIMKE